MRWLTQLLEATISVSGPAGLPIYRKKMGEYWLKNETGSVLLTLWWKVIFKTWCSTAQKRQKLFTEMYHKSYSSPEPQWLSSWQKMALFFSFTSLCQACVKLVDWCAPIRLNVHISLLEQESSTGSTLVSAWGATSIQWNIQMPRLHLVADVINHYEGLIQN